MSYFAPKQKDFHYMHHVDLLITDPDNPPTPDRIIPQVAHMVDGEPQDWFFDSFLFLHGNAPSGNSIYADINCGTSMCGEGDFHACLTPNPANLADWKQIIDFYFDKDGPVDRLNRSIACVADSLGAPPSKRNLILPIPYPHPSQFAFGRLDPNASLPLNFSCIRQRLDQASDARLKACVWFAEECVRRFSEAAPENLHLLGFYWLYESVHYSWDVDDHWVLKHLYPELGRMGMKHFWIPFFSTWNIGMMQMGQGMYWDCSFLQPNVMFYQRMHDVGEAAKAAKNSGCGIEMEYFTQMDPGTIRTRDERFERYRKYLNGGVEYGYMKESALAWFHGSSDFAWMSNSDDAQERELYHDTYDFVKGLYKIK